MGISEEDRHYPKFVLTHNTDLLVREMMELFLSYIIIQMVSMNTTTYKMEKLEIFRADSYPYFFL